jgi:acetolactate synthase-1/2/3 large subunit
LKSAIPASHDPRVQGLLPGSSAELFRRLRGVLPEETILVLDSGLHQNLARIHYSVLSAHGLLFPAGLQSMGFSIPAAIGAKLADPQRPVVALLGDGGLRMCGLEILTAVREQLPLTIIVLEDGHYGLIRAQQLDYDGTESGVRLQPIDYQMWAGSLGADYFDGRLDAIGAIEGALAARKPGLVEIGLGDTTGTRAARYKAKARGAIRQWFGKRRLIGPFGFGLRNRHNRNR